MCNAVTLPLTRWLMADGCSSTRVVVPVPLCRPAPVDPLAVQHFHQFLERKDPSLAKLLDFCDEVQLHRKTLRDAVEHSKSIIRGVWVGRKREDGVSVSAAELAGFQDAPDSASQRSNDAKESRYRSIGCSPTATSHFAMVSFLPFPSFYVRARILFRIFGLMYQRLTDIR